MKAEFDELLNAWPIPYPTFQGMRRRVYGVMFSGWRINKEGDLEPTETEDEDDAVRE